LNLLLYGAPGGGKGTQADYLRGRFGIPHVATGDILRAEVKAGTELGKQANAILERGELVPDEVIIGIVRRRLREPDCERGFILDGFPRTIPQAKALDRLMEEMGRRFQRVLYMSVPAEELIRRLSGRLTCPACQRTYHPEHNPPGAHPNCPHDGAELVMRDDDRPEAARHRIEVYLAYTLPVLDYYRKEGLVSEIDGLGTIQSVRHRVLAALGHAPDPAPTHSRSPG